jgi:hypothetical protein
MEQSWWHHLRPQAWRPQPPAPLSSSGPLAPLAPLAPAEVWKARALVLVYPTTAVILAVTLGLSATRLVVASAFFGLWVIVQFLTLSPPRRRQVLGRKPAPSSPPER